MFYEIFEVFELCHSYTCCTDVLCLSPAVPKLHMLSRFGAFEASSATVTLAVQMCPVWVQQCHSYTCCTDVPCLSPAVPQLHLLYRCALFKSSSATVTPALQMCPVWVQQCPSYTCCTDVPCLSPAMPQLHLLYTCNHVWDLARNRLSNLRTLMFFISSPKTDLTMWFVQALLQFIGL